MHVAVLSRISAFIVLTGPYTNRYILKRNYLNVIDLGKWRSNCLLVYSLASRLVLNVYFEYSQQVWGWLQRAWCSLDDCLPAIFRKFMIHIITVLRSRIILIGLLKSWHSQLLPVYAVIPPKQVRDFRVRTMVPCAFASLLDQGRGKPA